MTEDEMWKAVSQNDISYDGLFFYAVKSTKIYCKPSCKSKMPKRENVCYFKTSEEARIAGFRSCKRCKSNILDYQPIKEIANKAKKLLDDMWNTKLELDKEFCNIGITKHRLNEIFKAEYGITLFGYINNLRLEEAKMLLNKTNDEIIDIAYRTGFDSLSSFYRFFKNRTGLSPAIYRKGVGNE